MKCSNEGIANLLSYLTAAFQSAGNYEPAQIPVWRKLLDAYTDEQLERAAILICRHHARYHKEFAPGASHVVEAIEGVYVKEPIQALDLHNCKKLDYQGKPIIERWEESRIPYGDLAPAEWNTEALGEGSAPMLTEGE